MPKATANPSYLNAIMDRCVALELEYLSVVGRIDSKPYFLHHQESFPYITHRIGESTLIDIASDMQERTYPIIGRFVGGHLLKGIKGESDYKMYAYLPVLETCYTEAHYLTSTKYPAEIPELNSQPVTYQRSTGWRAFNNAGSDLPRQLGFEFMVRVTVSLDIRRRY